VPRFGLFHTDFETLERTPKQSVQTFSQVRLLQPRQMGDDHADLMIVLQRPGVVDTYIQDIGDHVWVQEICCDLILHHPGAWLNLAVHVAGMNDW
jgi:hypothetical protein